MRGARASSGSRPAPPTRLGVEHELCLWQGDDRVDFRQLINEVAGGIRPLDPGDPRARRLPSGAALTADGWEAELITPPVPVGAGTPERIDDLLRAERTQLRDVTAPHGVTRVSGFSSHLNVSVADDALLGLARTFVDFCLVALASVTEPAASAGVFVRPRRGRLEIGGEYVEGRDLIAALTLLAACVSGLGQGQLPPVSVPPQVTPSREKYGWFAPGPALHDDGTALSTVWEWARPLAEVQGLAPDPVDELVSGARPRRSSVDADPGGCTFGEHDRPAPACDTSPRMLRDGVSAETEWLTWQHAVWLLRDPDGRECRAVVGADEEVEFLEQLGSGGLDAAIRQMLRSRGPRRRLLVNAQVDEDVLWHDVRPGALVPAERLPDGTVPRVSRRAARRAHLRDRREEVS